MIFLDRVETFITSDIFIKYLLDNTEVDVSTFILQTLHDKIYELQEEGLK